MLEEILEVDERALVFTQFTEMGHVLQQLPATRRSAGRCCSCTAAWPRPQRDRHGRAVPEPSVGPPIFLLSLKAGGTGLNLTRANHVFHFDRWWNPAVENQATDRAFRIGQTRQVEVHKFVCLGTVEERIDETDRAQANLGGADRGQWRGLDDRTVYR